MSDWPTHEMGEAIGGTIGVLAACLLTHLTDDLVAPHSGRMIAALAITLPVGLLLIVLGIKIGDWFSN